MLYHLLASLVGYYSVLNVTRYITFRTAAASITAMVISLLIGPILIRRLKQFQFGQVIRPEGPASHRPKAGTPTMGGLLILTAAIVPTLLWADLTNVYVWVAVGSTMCFGLVGFLDDYLKISRGSHHGLWPRYKMGGQIAVGLGVGVTLLVLARYDLYNTRLIFPFFKQLIPDLGWFYAAFAMLVLVGSSNAVNLTDGLDGLAISAFAVAAGAVHRARLRHRPPRVRGVPADRALRAGGGADRLLRRAGRRQPRLPLVQLVSGRSLHGRRRLARARRRARHGGAADQAGAAAAARRRRCSCVEALSVIIQVASFKLTGQRVFRMAPLHHHFELLGWSEPKVIFRFLIVAIVFALCSLATLKLR